MGATNEQLLQGTVSAENYLKFKEGHIIMAKSVDGGPEVFHTVQGEGPRTGVPTVFVRVSGCNLNCSWCDTGYTWDWNTFEQSREQMWCSIQDLAEKIRSYNCYNVVISGGEPTLQQDNLIKLVDLLREDGKQWFFEIETNGSRVPSDELIERMNEINCSPKLQHSSNLKDRRYNEEALRKHLAFGKTIFKFVLGAPADIDEVLEIQAAIGIPTEKIWLMPEGKNRESIMDKMLWVIDLSKKYGFITCNRFHVQVWGAKRGI